MIKTNISKDEMNFAKNAIKHGQPVIFVRSRYDVILHNKKTFGDLKELNQVVADKFLDDCKFNCDQKRFYFVDI